MKHITIIRENNFLTMFSPYKIFIDDDFIDYLEPSEKNKTINVPDSSKMLKISVNKFSSNIVRLDNKKISISVTSQIHNGLFILIFGCFCGSLILKLLGVLNNYYLGIALLSPMLILVYWQTLGKNNYLRISKR